MMLTIYGLPPKTRYHEVKSLIKQECNLIDFILDNLTDDGDNSKKVRLGLSDDNDGYRLIKNLDGFRMSATHILKVVPIGKSNQPQSQYESRSNYQGQPRNDFQNQRNDYQNQTFKNYGNQSSPAGIPRQFPERGPPDSRNFAPSRPDMGQNSHSMPFGSQNRSDFQDRDSFRRPDSSNFQNRMDSGFQRNDSGYMTRERFESKSDPHGRGDMDMARIENQGSRIDVIQNRQMIRPVRTEHLMDASNQWSPNMNNVRSPAPFKDVSNPMQNNINLQQRKNINIGFNQQPMVQTSFPQGRPLDPPYGFPVRNNVPEPVTIKKEHFQGPVQQVSGHMGAPQAPGHMGHQGHVAHQPWAAQANQQKPYEKPYEDRRFAADKRPDPKQMQDYDNRNFDARSARNISPGRNYQDKMYPPSDRRISPQRFAGRDMSDKRMSPTQGRKFSLEKRLPSPGRRQMSPGRRPMSPGRRLMSPVRRAISPGRRPISSGMRPVSPGRRLVSPGRRLTSPGRRNLSPGRRLVSPGKRPFSPGRRQMSPGRRPMSPGHGQRAPSPGRRLVSPGRRLPSPNRRQMSPGRRQLSPKRPAFVDRRQLSPGRRQMSPGRRKLSPGRRQMSPGRRQMSPGRRQMSPGRLQLSPGRRQMSPGRRQLSPGRRQLSPGRLQMSPGRRQMSPGRRQMSPARRQMSPGRRQMSPGRRQASPGRHQISPGRRQMSPGRRQMSPGRRQNSPGRRDETRRLSPSDRRLASIRDEVTHHYSPHKRASPSLRIDVDSKRPRFSPRRQIDTDKQLDDKLKSSRPAYDPQAQSDYSSYREEGHDKHSRRSPWDKGRRHSPSPRSPRRSWAQERRRSPSPPPPPVWNTAPTPAPAPARDHQVFSSDIDRDFQDVYQRAQEFRKRAEELRKTGDKRCDEQSPRSDATIKRKKIALPSSVRAKRDRAGEEIVSKILEPYDLKENEKSRLTDELKLSVGNILLEMFGDRDVSFIELVVKYRARRTHRDDQRLLRSVLDSLPAHYRRTLHQRIADKSDIPAKVSRFSDADSKEEPFRIKLSDSTGRDSTIAPPKVIDIQPLVKNQSHEMVPAPVFASTFQEIPEDQIFRPANLLDLQQKSLQLQLQEEQTKQQIQQLMQKHSQNKQLEELQQLQNTHLQLQMQQTQLHQYQMQLTQTNQEMPQDTQLIQQTYYQAMQPSVVMQPMVMQPSVDMPQVQPFTATTLEPAPLDCEQNDNVYKLFLCQDDFEAFTDMQAECLKNFLVSKIIQFTEGNPGWAPDFTLKGLQNNFRYELTTTDELSKNWILNLDFSDFNYFNVLVYTKEELWYERAAIWLPGHSRCKIEPFEKLRLQNKRLENINIGNWKFVKKIVTVKGTRLYVDMPPSDARALECNKMLLSYELTKVNVILKAVAIDKKVFDAGLKQQSIWDTSQIITAVQNCPMPSLNPNHEPDIVKIALNGTKTMTIEQARKIKEIVVYNIFKYHEQGGNFKTDFVKYGFCPPNYFGIVPENKESKRWLLGRSFGKLNRQTLVVVTGEEDYFTMYTHIPNEYHQNKAIMIERLKQSNQGIKGLNFHLWRIIKFTPHERRGFHVVLEIDMESLETLSKTKYQLDYVTDCETVTITMKSEYSISKLEEKIKRYKSEQLDSYDVANMELESDSDTEVICLS